MKVTEEQLLDLISEEAIVTRDRLVRDAPLEDLGITSLDVITTVFELEERFGVVVEADEVRDFKTLGEMVDFLLGRINAEAEA
jgi:acyl carrier protein